MKNLLFIACLMSLISSQALAQSYLVEETELGYGRYLTGGVTSIVVGFGAGQAVQGRYAEKGWIFTLGETASVGMIAGGYLWLVPSFEEGESPMGPAGLMLAGFTALVAFRTWGVIDAWSAPYASGNRTAQASRDATSKLAFMPWISTQGAGFSMRF